MRTPPVICKVKHSRKQYVVLGAALVACGAVLFYLTRETDSGFDSRWNYNADTGSSVTVPSMSPDGSNIIFDSFDAGYRINRVSRDGRTVTVLFESQDRLKHPIYTPDGKTIAFSKTSDGYEHLWTMDSNGSNHVQLTYGHVLDVPYSFSQDGSTLFYVRITRYGGGFIPRKAIFEVKLADPKRNNRVGDAIAISPDGSTLVHRAYDTDPVEDGLWIMNRDGSNKLRLGVENTPVFSPIGKQFAYQSRNSLIVVNWDGSHRQNYDLPYGANAGLAFCLGGKAILFRDVSSVRGGKEKTRGCIYLLTLEDAKVEKILHIE